MQARSRAARNNIKQTLHPVIRSYRRHENNALRSTVTYGNFKQAQKSEDAQLADDKRVADESTDRTQ